MSLPRERLRTTVVAGSPAQQLVAAPRRADLLVVYEALRDSDTAEVAVAVAPAWRHVGLATALVPLLAAAAVRNGLRAFTAEFFADNVDVTDPVAEAGAPYQDSSVSGVVAAEVTLPGGGPGGQ